MGLGFFFLCRRCIDR